MHTYTARYFHMHLIFKMFRKAAFSAYDFDFTGNNSKFAFVELRFGYILSVT